MKECQTISPEQIFSGNVKYTAEQFRQDIFRLNKETIDSQERIDSLNSLIDSILEDISTNNEPEDFLKQFYQANYDRFMLDDAQCNVAVIGYKYLSTSSFTSYLYLICASFLKDRFDNGLLPKAEFDKIKTQYFESFIELVAEQEIHKSLMDIVDS
jgi:hypothetical protein